METKRTRLSVALAAIVAMTAAVLNVADSRAEDTPVIKAGEPPDSALQQMEQFTPPQLISTSKAVYPDLAERASVSGQLYVNTLVGPDGVPIKTDILSQEPEMAFLFDEAGRRYAMNCRFKPALDSSGQPTQFWVSIPFRFTIPGFTPPVCEYIPEPEYPETARELGLEGWVGIMVLVDQRGRPDGDQVYIVAREHPEIDTFDASARDAARQTRFTPAYREDISTDAWAFVKIEYKLISN